MRATGPPGQQVSSERARRGESFTADWGREPKAEPSDNVNNDAWERPVSSVSLAQHEERMLRLRKSNDQSVQSDD